MPDLIRIHIICDGGPRTRSGWLSLRSAARHRAYESRLLQIGQVDRPP